jgi:hypothetical protein
LLACLLIRTAMVAAMILGRGRRLPCCASAGNAAVNIATPLTSINLRSIVIASS